MKNTTTNTTEFSVHIMNDSRKKYNGWHNYATWVIAFSCRSKWQAVAKKFFDGYDIEENQFNTECDLAVYLKEVVIESVEANGQNIAVDYALAFIDECNFYEIAEHLWKALSRK